MAATLQLRFTFSPVQEFVSEARKTADLRTGSYLLSYLAAQAIAATIREGADEQDFFPSIEDNELVQTLLGKDARTPRRYGSLPNSFTVRVESEEQGARWGQAASEALRTAWHELAERAWDYVVRRHGAFDATDIRAIRDRQIRGQWQASWVVSESASDLGARKQIRAFEPSEEQGEKCTVCGYRQVLATGDARGFWGGVVKGPLGAENLVRTKERLCAVCLTKRVLPVVLNLDRKVPSTPDIAASPWREKVISKLSESLVRDAVSEVVRAYHGRDRRDPEDAFRGVESGYFFEGFEVDEPDAEEKRRRLERPVRELFRAVGARPSRAYAILAMDGDRMGEHLSRLDDAGRRELSSLILEFSRAVGGLVSAGGRDSCLVYAGGEDVLALLPSGRALEIALALNRKYHEVLDRFREPHALPDGAFTVSAGLLICPMTLPLRTAIPEAQRLERIAKEAGRDALAVSVWKGGGSVLTVARKWDFCRSDGAPGWVRQLADLALEERPRYPSSFLYQTIELLRSLGLDREKPDLDERAVEDLVAVEYSGSREPGYQVKDVNEAREKIKPLLALARRGGWDPDVIRLVRYLHEEERA